jgi:hypothetical protein
MMRKSRGGRFCSFRPGKLFLGTLVALFIALTFVEAPRQSLAIDEITQEQLQQLEENFEALQSSFSEGKEKIEKIQSKLQEIKDKYGNNRQVVKLLNELDQAGLSSKLKKTHGILDQFDKGAKRISDKVEKVKEIVDFYNTWKPDKENPVRPLEQIGSALGELENLIQTIDPSPENVLTKPITEIIAFYKDASEAFAGALKKLNSQIDTRRGHSIGPGGASGVGDPEKVRKYNEMKTGETIQPYPYIKLRDAEIWVSAVPGGGRAFIWDGKKWTEIDGGIGRLAEVYYGWRLAHGQIISTDNLISRCNAGYDKVEEAKKRAPGYWDILNSGDFCTQRIFKARGKEQEKEHIITNSGFERNVFIARYMFLESTRKKVDALIKVYENTLLVQGTVKDSKGHGVGGAKVMAKINNISRQSISQQGGWFSLLFDLRPDPTSRQNASVTASHPEHKTYEGEQRLWEKCEYWSIDLKEKQEGVITESIVILLDASGSMKENNRMAQAKASARSVLSKITPETEVALIVFYDCGHIVVEQDFTTDPAAISAILPRIQPSSKTPLGAATKFAKNYLKENSRGKQRRLVILTDGEETCGGDPISEARE